MSRRFAAVLWLALLLLSQACASDDDDTSAQQAGANASGGTGQSGASGAAAASGGAGGANATAGDDASGTSGGNAGTSGGGSGSSGANADSGEPDAMVDGSHAGDDGGMPTGTVQPGGACDAASECFVPSSCVVGLCVTHACQQANASNGLAAAAYEQVDADCQQLVCDGEGHTRAVADLDDAPVAGCDATVTETTGDYSMSRRTTPLGVSVHENFYEVTEARELESFEISMDIDVASYDVTFLVLEADALDGTGTLLWSKDATLAMGTQTFYSSGAIDGVTLQAGKFYALGIMWDEPMGPLTSVIAFSAVAPAAPIDVSFGQLVATRGAGFFVDPRTSGEGTPFTQVESMYLGLQRITTKIR